MLFPAGKLLNSAKLTTVFKAPITTLAYPGYMPRFFLPYPERPVPPPMRWTAWRVFLWTLLATMLAFWASAMLMP
jgi:hypothetical protein